MEFSNSYKEGGPFAWSPDGSMLASCDNNRMMVKEASTLMVVNIFCNQDAVSKVEWSPDGKYVLCAMYKRGIVQVWDVHDPSWHCKIGEGPAGLASSRWGPDERHILNVNEFNVRITVWSLSSSAGVLASLRAPKFAEKGIDISNDRKFIAVAERKDCKDFVQIYGCGSWTPVQRFQVETKDLADLKWSPDDRVIGVWDSCLEYVFLAYSPDGRRLGRYQAYDGALGIKSVAFAPSSQFVAVGSYDGVARLVNQLTWRPVQDCVHTAGVPSSEALVYQEKDLSGAVTQPIMGDLAAHAVARSAYELVRKHDPAVKLNVLKVDPEKANPKTGVGVMQWSADSSLLATRADNMPHALWVWDAQNLSLLSVVQQISPVKAFRWHPSENKLALCTGGHAIYLWSDEGAACIEIPTINFCAHALEWAPNGKALLLQDRDAHCLAFPTS